MSIRAIDPVCPQVISAMIGTLFPSEMVCVTNISSINCNNTLLFRICCLSLFYVATIHFFQMYACKFDKLSISTKFNL